ncbi:MAG: hypothetical protein EPO30_01815 [Lysobacteraceae bacterium]|nr:MAG: hypothetical protein EPO30_01815 [Xanthomonadaceae bacterium]
MIPLALFLVLGLAASLYVVRARRPREERAAGLRMLGTLAWPDFIQLVLAVLNGRGYERSFGGAGTEGEYLLERGGQKWLLSSRHSRAWKPGTTGIAEFASHLRQQGLEGGILAIPGRFPPSAFSVGKAHRIELLDGPTMWDELAPALGDHQLRQIEQAARRRLLGQYALAWAAAAVVALLAAMALAQNPPATDPIVGGAQAPTPEATPAPEVAARAAPTTEGAAAPTMKTAAPDSLIPLEERRTTIAAAVADLPHVVSAHWPTPSTLQVIAKSEAFDPQSICPLLRDDPELGASRLQVQYPAGSERPVRFSQCRAY